MHATPAALAQATAPLSLREAALQPCRCRLHLHQLLAPRACLQQPCCSAGLASLGAQLLTQACARDARCRRPWLAALLGLLLLLGVLLLPLMTPLQCQPVLGAHPGCCCCRRRRCCRGERVSPAPAWQLAWRCQTRQAGHLRRVGQGWWRCECDGTTETVLNARAS